MIGVVADGQLCKPRGLTGKGQGCMVGQDEQTERERIFDELFRHHRNHISLLVRRVVRPHEVKDVEQEVFLALWGSIRSLPQEIPARGSWIRELARRVAFGWLRKEIKNQGGKPDPVGCGAVRPVLLQMDEAGIEAESVLAKSFEHPGLESTLIIQEQDRWRRKVFKRALDDLSPELRAAYIEVRVNGSGSVEAASKLGIGRNTLLSRIRDANDRISKSLSVAALDGVVFDSTGKRIGARVRLEAAGTSSSICEAEANKRDPVRFEGLQPGEYIIRAEAAGYGGFRRPLTLSAGLTEVHMTLQPDKSDVAPE